MKKGLFTLIVAASLGSAWHTAAAQTAPEDLEPERERRAQTGMKFLSFSVDPRAAALGDAVVAGDRGSVSLFNNPASLAATEGAVDVFLAQSQWAATDIRYNALAAAFRPMDGLFGVFGVSLMAVDYGDFLGTVRSDAAAGGYEDTGVFSPTALSLGVGYGRALTDRFAVGGQVKYVTEDLGSSFMSRNEGGSVTGAQDNQTDNIAFDLGITYRTGFRSLALGAAFRNFAGEVKYERENLELPLALELGVSMNLLDLTSMNPAMHSLNLSVSGSRPRDFDEQINVGLEYLFSDLVALRAGYAYPSGDDARGLNLGAGLNVGVGGLRLGVDYAYTDYDVLGNVNRFALRVGL